MNKLLTKTVNYVYKHPVQIIVIWLFLFCAGIFLASKLGSVIINKFPGPSGSNSALAREIINREFKNLSSDNLLLVLHSETYSRDSEQFINYEKKMAGVLTENENVNSVQFSRENNVYIDENTTFLLISLNTEHYNNRMISELRKIISDVPSDKQLKPYLTGLLAYSYDAFLYGSEELRKVEKFAIMLSLLVLVYVFGSLYSAVIPVIAGLICLSLGFASLYMIAYFFEATSMSQVVVSILSLALGIDYPLFILSRFREEYTKSKNSLESFIIAARTSGEAVIFSGAMIITGSVFILIAFRRVIWIYPSAACTIVVVITSVLLGLTLIPALLFLTEKYFNLEKLIRHKFMLNFSDKIWTGIAAFIKEKPLPVLLLSLLLLVVLIIPALKINIWYPNISQGIEHLESKKGFDYLAKNNLSGQLSPIYVIFENNGPVMNKEFLSGLKALSDSLEKDERVKSITSLVNWNKNFGLNEYLTLYSNPLLLTGYPALQNFVSNGQDKSLMMLTSAYPPDSKETKELIKEIRQARLKEGTNIFVGGSQAESVDGHEFIKKRFPYVISLNIITIMLILAFYLKSVIIPVKAIITNLIPVFAALGIVVMVFQYGYGAEFIGAEKNGYIMSITPITLFTVLFGLSIDYEVMILSRIREKYNITGNNTEAVIEGITKTGRVIIGAALVMLGVFGSYMLADINTMKEISLSLFTAVLAEATIVRLVVVPATMLVLGDWNYWWPFRKK